MTLFQMLAYAREKFQEIVAVCAGKPGPAAQEAYLIASEAGDALLLPPTPFAPGDAAQALATCKAALTQIQALSAGAALPYVREINTIAVNTLIQVAGVTEAKTE